MKKLSIFIIAIIALSISISITYAQAGQDRDGDGVDDSVDSCISDPGPTSNNGCPVATDVPPSTDTTTNNSDDRDGDGTVDSLDNCPDSGGPASNAGCPVDDTTTQPEPTAEPTVAPLPPLPTTGNCVVATATNARVNVRSFPSLDAPIIGVLEPEPQAAAYIKFDGVEGESMILTPLGFIAESVLRFGGQCGRLFSINAEGLEFRVLESEIAIDPPIAVCCWIMLEVLEAGNPEPIMMLETFPGGPIMVSNLRAETIPPPPGHGEAPLFEELPFILFDPDVDIDDFSNKIFVLPEPVSGAIDLAIPPTQPGPLPPIDTLPRLTLAPLVDPEPGTGLFPQMELSSGALIVEPYPLPDFDLDLVDNIPLCEMSNGITLRDPSLMIYGNEPRVFASFPMEMLSGDRVRWHVAIHEPATATVNMELVLNGVVVESTGERNIAQYYGGYSDAEPVMNQENLLVTAFEDNTWVIVRHIDIGDDEPAGTIASDILCERTG